MNATAASARRRLRITWLKVLALVGWRLSNSDAFDLHYAGAPPWEIGKPQPDLVALVDSGAFTGRVLDLGCGSGENAIYMSQHGLCAFGLDLSPEAVELAGRKARERHVQAQFRVGDALHLEAEPEPFDTVVSSGVLHLFSEAQSKDFAASVGRVIKRGGTCFTLALSRENGPGPWPPGQSENEIRAAFHDGWRLNFIRAARIESTFGDLKALLASFSREQPLDAGIG